MGKEECAIVVGLPHDAMLTEPCNALAAGGGNVGWHRGHDYSYIKPGQELAGQDLILEFEGVYHNAEVYLNEEKLMFRPCSEVCIEIYELVCSEGLWHHN